MEGMGRYMSDDLVTARIELAVDMALSAARQGQLATADRHMRTAETLEYCYQLSPGIQSARTQDYDTIRRSNSHEGRVTAETLRKAGKHK